MVAVSYWIHDIYRRFLIRFRGGLSVVIPNNKTIEHRQLKVMFYCNVVKLTIFYSLNNFIT